MNCSELNCSYNSHKSNIDTLLQTIGKTLDKLSISYDNITLLGEFNFEPEEAKMSEFLNNIVSQIFLSKKLFQKLRKFFLCWFDFDKLLTDFSKHRCFWNRAVRFLQTYIYSRETILSKRKPKVVFHDSTKFPRWFIWKQTWEWVI